MPTGFGLAFEELAEVDVELDTILEDLKDELPEELADNINPELFVDASLATLVYEILVPRVAAFAGASECEIRRRGWR